jgi:hypothetical protein
LGTQSARFKCPIFGHSVVYNFDFDLNFSRTLVITHHWSLIKGVPAQIKEVSSLIKGVPALIKGVWSLIEGVPAQIKGVSSLIKKV